MTHSFRAVLRLAAGTTFAVVIAVSAWLILIAPQGRTADCVTAHAMWTYYESQVASARSAALESGADNHQTERAYQHMVDELQASADRITTPDIRAKADTIVAINRDMFEDWKRWVAESPSEPFTPTGSNRSDRQFAIEFAQDAKKLKTAHAELDSACRS